MPAAAGAGTRSCDGRFSFGPASRPGAFRKSPRIGSQTSRPPLRGCSQFSFSGKAVQLHQGKFLAPAQPRRLSGVHSQALSFRRSASSSSDCSITTCDRSMCWRVSATDLVVLRSRRRERSRKGTTASLHGQKELSPTWVKLLEGEAGGVHRGSRSTRYSVRRGCVPAFPAHACSSSGSRRGSPLRPALARAGLACSIYGHSLRSPRRPQLPRP
jgi:hypothetical protein